MNLKEEYTPAFVPQTPPIHTTPEIKLQTKNGHKLFLCAPYFYFDGERTDTPDHGKCIGKAAYGAGHSALFPAFYETLRTGADMPVSHDSALAAHCLLFAAYRSNGTDIPIFIIEIVNY